MTKPNLSSERQRQMTFTLTEELPIENEHFRPYSSDNL